MIVLFFGGSIFVHELGHYLAARARGVHVEVFSIGFGPPIFSWKGADGTRYQVAWFPLGGFVLLPQIADLGPLEGESRTDAATLPPVTYGTKVLVFVAGAVFNVLFAFALACLVWKVGQPVNDESTSTTIGFITKTVDLPDGTHVPSPASESGLMIGDVVKAIDGHHISDWDELHQTLAMGTQRGPDGSPLTVFTIERAGASQQIVLHPRLVGDERWRQIGIAPGYALNVHSVVAGSSAEKAGLLPGDRILRVNGTVVLSSNGFVDALSAEPARPATLNVLRASREETRSVTYPGAPDRRGSVRGHRVLDRFPPGPPVPAGADLAAARPDNDSTFWGLINPNSNVGLSKLSGPIGIVHIFHEAADAGFRYVLIMAILINVNLAFLNLLPIPVLDGGQILFATIARLRGRALSVNFIVDDAEHLHRAHLLDGDLRELF